MKKVNAILFVSLVLLCSCGHENAVAQESGKPGVENLG